MKSLIKILILIFFIDTSIDLYGQTEADTITNWQLYKGKELLFKSNDVSSTIYTAVISLKDEFNHLKLSLFYDFLSEKIHRKIEFVVNGKNVKSISEFKQAREPFLIRKEDMKDLIIRYRGEVLGINYTDKINPNGIFIGLLKFTD